MQYQLTFAALLGASTVLALPATNTNVDGLRVHQVNHGYKARHFQVDRLKVYHKYARHGAVPPKEFVKAAQAATQRGSVVATPDNGDTEYLCPVTVGGSQLNLDFDTGSSDLWVFSTDTPSSESSGHDLYQSSSGTRKQGYTWDITYQDQSGSKGIVYADKVVIGGVTATSQAVEAATSVSQQFTDNKKNDGLVGLAFSSDNTVKPQKQNTFFDNVKSTLPQALFTVTLKHNKPGSYDFGFIDDSKHTGTIKYSAVDSSNGAWEFQAGPQSVGSSSPSGTSVGTAIPDTGTTLIYIPSSQAKNYYKSVSGSYYDDDEDVQAYVFPCSSSTPDWNVQIAGVNYKVPGSQMNYGSVGDGSNNCVGGIQPNTGIGLSILGDLFLKSVYAVFDQTQSSPRVGFAPQAN